MVRLSLFRSSQMNVDVCFSPKALTEDAVKGKIVVVIDVLRACSTIVTALAHGAREVFPVADRGEAGRVAAQLDPETSLLGGEQGGQRIEGYGAGNSPLEYEPMLVAGKIVVLTTSNGTRAFTSLKGPAETVVGCFLNLSRVVDFLRELDEQTNGVDENPHVLILCVGHDGCAALEDVLCAGMILHRLWSGRAPSGLADGARIALTQYRSVHSRLARSLFNCAHTQRLIALGFGDDVAYCARVDAIPLLPRYDENLLILDVADKERARELVSALPENEEELAEAIEV